MYYYRAGTVQAVSPVPVPELGEPVERSCFGTLCLLTQGDPVLGRGGYRITAPGMLEAGDTLAALDESRLPRVELEEPLRHAMSMGRLMAVNRNRPGWQRSLGYEPSRKKRRFHILAVGDVGSTVLLGLKLLGSADVDTVGICDISGDNVKRWVAEMGQISPAWDYDAFPRVEAVDPEHLFDCDVFIFTAARGIPPTDSGVRDVRMAQFETNAELVKTYARMARRANYRGLWAAVSDPVDLLAKTAYLESNRDEDGNWDGKGMMPEQIQGYGLGVMNARAAWYARSDPRFARFLTEGRAFGPHGQGLVIADSVSDYSDALSRELTDLALGANMEIRRLGYKPYVAPALSSAVFSILATVRGDWHYGSVFLDGVYMGCRNRYTRAGIETELLPRIPDSLWERIEDAARILRASL